jgi:hypothetical protein
MSAVEVIKQIRALPEEERAKVVRFVIEHEESWIPAEFREAMDEAAEGKMVKYGTGDGGRKASRRLMAYRYEATERFWGTRPSSWPPAGARRS